MCLGMPVLWRHWLCNCRSLARLYPTFQEVDLLIDVFERLLPRLDVASRLLAMLYEHSLLLGQCALALAYQRGVRSHL